MDFFTIATIIGGSRLYNLHNFKSDHDMRYIVLEPFEYMLGLHQTKDYTVVVQNEHRDEVVYGLNKFVNLAMKGNPSVIELLYAEPLEGHTYWNQIVNIRHLFITKKTISSYKGIINKLLIDMHSGKGRVDLIEKFGYDTKNASHIYRLISDYTSILEYGRPKAMLTDGAKAMASAIKSGTYITDKDELYKNLKGLFDATNKYKPSIDFDDIPKYDIINKVVLSIYKAAYGVRI